MSFPLVAEETISTYPNSLIEAHMLRRKIGMCVCIGHILQEISMAY